MTDWLTLLCCRWHTSSTNFSIWQVSLQPLTVPALKSDLSATLNDCYTLHASSYRLIHSSRDTYPTSGVILRLLGTLDKHGTNKISHHHGCLCTRISQHKYHLQTLLSFGVFLGHTCQQLSTQFWAVHDSSPHRYSCVQSLQVLATSHAFVNAHHKH